MNERNYNFRVTRNVAWNCLHKNSVLYVQCYKRTSASSCWLKALVSPISTPGFLLDSSWRF